MSPPNLKKPYVYIRFKPFIDLFHLMKRTIVIGAMASLVTWCACQKANDQTPATPGKPSTPSTPVTPPSGVKHKRIYLKQGGDKGFYSNGKDFSYEAGDTLVLKENDWSYCSFENFYGTKSDPLVIVNEAAQIRLSAGFAFSSCKYIKLTGSGTSDKYGFLISDAVKGGVGVDIHGHSSNIEVERIDITRKTYGYWVKQEGSCVDSLQYPNFTISDIHIHDGRIHNVTQEGMYLGSTDPNGTRAVNCSGSVIYPRPLRLGNITVNNMIIDSTNRSGIQLSGADQGTNEIYSNTVSNSGFEYNTAQGNGISLGGYTHANVHDNSINHSFALGILVLGAGKIDIENNTVDNSGNLNGKVTPGMASIMVDTRRTDPVVKSTLIIKNNKLGSNTDKNVRFYETFATYNTDNQICNSGTLVIPGDIKYTTCN
ncbi:right-handed parallel beta-helix repeat-containing protein [Deminuibacter soli]|nr:right-handed parallel beta-helix repeat-containing protein [Deminuibacter soli]